MICCFCIRMLTEVRSLPVSVLMICFSRSSIHESISSTLCCTITSRLASNRRAPFSLVLVSSSSKFLDRSVSFGSMISLNSGFSTISSWAAFFASCRRSLLAAISASNA
uniref:Putative secreted protein n=1 Tax=Anopheles marajoara TaxID=58244 RepID=A0A2M4C816_9DIPT